MVAMKTTEADIPLYQTSQLTYTETGDSLMIVCARSQWYCAICVKVIWKCNRDPVFLKQCYVGYIEVGYLTVHCPLLNSDLHESQARTWGAQDVSATHPVPPISKLL